MATPIPFPKCWWVHKNLLAGPAFFAGSRTELNDNLDALAAANIGMIVSLIGIHELFSDEEEGDEVAWEIMSRFSHFGFALPDGSAPNELTMKIILGWIDVGQMEGGKVYLHCLSGRGRTGTAAGCWLARHAIASGEAVIDHLVERRRAAGLSGACPETAAQHELVVNWRKDQ
jgi:protein-tyrosine phosphatase